MTNYRYFCPKHPDFDVVATMTNTCGLCGTKLEKEQVSDDYYDNF